MAKPPMLGKRFGRLTVVEQATKRSDTHRYWKCQCDCGKVIEVPTTNLNGGKSRSCGCYHRDNLTERNTTHGMTGTRLFNIWCEIRRRCDDDTRENYPRYGGRGIRYHRVFDTFQGFLDNIPEGYADHLTIDRIDVDGDYEPGNLRWATNSEQQRNKRNNHLVELSDGLRRTIADASGMFGIPERVISDRLSRGWNHYDAITVPVRRDRRHR